MIFADLFFLYIFIPAAAICYAIAYLLDKKLVKVDENGRALVRPANYNPRQNIVLVIFSLIFYAWGEPVYILLMLASVTVNFFVGKAIDKGKDEKSKPALVIGVIINILFIAVFKYSGFVIESINAFGLNLPVPDISLPIGISFYTFQAISYIADVYRGKVRAQRKYVNLLLYISMFPQLIAGPIVRYTTVVKQIRLRKITAQGVSSGLFRFFIGLAKKVLLANQLAELSGALLDADVAALSVTGAWIGIIAFGLQIYFDFSGYSDMAIGMGRCFGFRFDENFNYPYISRSITEFWRRWHISLGSFFRDYIYIPMGGNRRHQALNIFVVWFLTGLWHGASWNFVLWGLYFGVIISLEKVTVFNLKKPLPRVIGHIYSLFLIFFGWAIFYYSDFSTLGTFIRALFGLNGSGLTDPVTTSELTSNMFLLIAAAVCCVPIAKYIEKLYNYVIDTKGTGSALLMNVLKVAVSGVLLYSSTILLVGESIQSFFYFRF